MNKKQPFILNFENLYELYNKLGLPDTEDFLLWRSNIGSDVDNPKLWVNNIWERKQKKVLDILTKYKLAIDEIEDAMLEFVQFQVLLDPQVYVARTRDIKTGIEYFTAKTFLPLKGGNKKELKIYVGKAKDFNYETTNKRAHMIAKMKIMPPIARRIVV